MEIHGQQTRPEPPIGQTTTVLHSADDLPWNQITLPTSEATLVRAEDASFYYLEEIEGVDVVYEDMGSGSSGTLLKFKVGVCQPS